MGGAATREMSKLMLTAAKSVKETGTETQDIRDFWKIEMKCTGSTLVTHNVKRITD